MANNFITTDKVADYALDKFSESITFLRGVNRAYDDSFARKDAKIGDTLRVPVPQHGLVRKGRIADPTPLQTIVRPVTVYGQRGIDVVFNSAEMALDIEELGRRYIDQQIADLAVSIEAEVLAMAIQATPNQVGPVTTDFTTGNALYTANLARKIQEDNGAFKGTKEMLLSTAANLRYVDSLKGLFNSQEQLKVQYEQGYMGTAAGYKWNNTTVMPGQNRGAANGAYTVAAGQTGSTIAVAAGTGSLNVGDIVTFPGVFAVHPQTKQNLNYLRTFVITQTYAGGAGNISIYPAITPTGSEQNVTNATTGTGNLGVQGTASTPYDLSLAFVKDAFTFGTVDLPEYPDRPCSRRVYDGISMRVAQGSDIINDQFIMRFDIMCAFGALRPEFACRLAQQGTLTPPA